MPNKKYDVLTIGNALLDISSNVPDEFLADQSVRKGSMDLVSSETTAELVGRLESLYRSSGGSAANTAVGVTSFGGSSAFMGNVAADEWGKIFIQDLTSLGVNFIPAGDPATASQPTGCCVVLVTPDGERTMVTNLGASTSFTPTTQKQYFADASIVLSEGYAWDSDELLETTQEAAAVTRQAGGLFALSLSDVGCVERYREQYLAFLVNVDILFANELEIEALYSCNFFEAVQKVQQVVPVAFLTKGAQGSFIVTNNQAIEVAAPKVVAIDTTGAGDQYAAGTLFGLSQKMSPVEAAHLGSIAAAEVVSHQGARPQIELSTLL